MFAVNPLMTPDLSCVRCGAPDPQVENNQPRDWTLTVDNSTGESGRLEQQLSSGDWQQTSIQNHNNL